MKHWRPERGDAGPAARRAPVPQILQIEAVECGAASLAMVLAKFGLWLPLEQARTACGVSRDGSKASNILAAARRYGMEAKGFRKEVAELASLSMPLILHWNFNHFVVLEGIADGRAFIADPAAGKREVPLDEFEDSFTGVAIRLTPGPEFRPGGNPPRRLAGLAERLGDVRGELALIGCLAVLLVLPAIAIPAFTRIFIDGVVVGGQKPWLKWLVIGMIATAAGRFLLSLLQQKLLIRLFARLSVGASAKFMWHMLRLPVGFFAQRHPGDVARRVAASDRVANLLSTSLAQTALDVATALMVGALMLVYDPILGGIAVLLVLPNILVIRLVDDRQTRATQREVIEYAKLQGASVGAIQTIETLKASGLENQAFARWAGHQAKLLDIRRTIGGVNALTQAMPALFRLLSSIIILGVGAWRVIRGDITVGTLVAFQALASTFVEPLGRFVALATTFRVAYADLARVDDALENPLDPQLMLPPAAGAVRPRGAVELRGVAFGYNPLDPPLIRDFDLKLEPGARVALVGGSGSGKSTVARLLTGLIQPWEGEILLDGVPLDRMDAGTRARIMATVDQDIFLFAGTVRDNLTLWNSGVEDQRLIAALEDAALLPDVLARPGRLDAVVDEGGANLSGGQRQRMEIARALVGDPALLVLDEATAALDPATEQRIEERLRRRGATCVIVAHRLSTIRDCDEIVVMKAGRIVERGTHDDLLARNGEYAALILAH